MPWPATTQSPGSVPASATSTSICKRARRATPTSQDCCRPFATGSLRHLLSDEGDDLLGSEALVTVFDLRSARTGASARRRDGLHRDGVGRSRPGPQAPPAGGRRGVVDHAAPRRARPSWCRWRSAPASTVWASSSSPRTCRTCSPRTRRGPSPATPGGRSYRTPPSSSCSSRTRRPSAPSATPSTCPKTSSDGSCRARVGTASCWRGATASPSVSRPRRRRTAVIEWRPGRH